MRRIHYNDAHRDTQSPGPLYKSSVCDWLVKLELQLQKRVSGSNRWAQQVTRPTLSETEGRYVWYVLYVYTGRQTNKSTLCQRWRTTHTLSASSLSCRLDNKPGNGWSDYGLAETQPTLDHRDSIPTWALPVCAHLSIHLIIQTFL